MSGFRFASSSDAWLAITALRAAAVVFADDAKRMGDAGHLRMQQQFIDQQNASHRIADEIEAQS